MTTLKAQIVKIGNSRGIRLPKTVLEQAKFGSEIEIAVSRGKLVIRSHPRAGWAEQFKAMAKHGDDKLLDEPTPTRWDETEWKW